MNIKHGFTLPEILITLTIVGIVAAIAMPALKGAKPNQEMIMLKKAYYLVSRTVGELINDEELYPDNEDHPELDGFANVSIQEQTGTEATYRNVSYGGNSPLYPSRLKFCGLFAARMNLVGSDRCSNITTFVGQNGRSVTGHFTTVDGMEWVMPITIFDTGMGIIQVDVNGNRKGFNCFEGNGCKEPDRFLIQVYKDGQIAVPPNGIERQYLSSQDNTRKYSEFINGRR